MLGRIFLKQNRLHELFNQTVYKELLFQLVNLSSHHFTNDNHLERDDLHS